MCLGTQGFQIADSRTADGRDWDWTTAFTAKGGYANTLIAGLLSDKMGRSYWNLDTGELQLTGEFIQRAEDGTLSVAITKNHIEFYSWEDNGGHVGSIGAVRRADDGRRGVEMWCDNGDMLWLGYDDGTTNPDHIKPIFTFDTQNLDSTPAIINTVSGTIFPSNTNGGIVFQNVLIKTWGLKLASGALSVITGISWNSYGITRIYRANLTISCGLIESLTTSSKDY